MGIFTRKKTTFSEDRNSISKVNYGKPYIRLNPKAKKIVTASTFQYRGKKVPKKLKKFKSYD